MKNLKKILYFVVLIAVLFSLFNTVQAEELEDNNENIVENNNIFTLALDPRVTVKQKEKFVYDPLPRKEKDLKKEKIIITGEMLANWPHKHKLVSNNEKKIHKPAWMYGIGLADNCKKGTMYFVLDESGNKIDKYEIMCAVQFEDGEIKKSFSEELFKGLDKTEDKTEDKNQSPNDDDEKEVDNFIEDLLGYKSSKILKSVSVNEEKIVLGGNKLATSVKAFSLEKEKLEVKDFEINGLKNKDYYNGLVARLFTSFVENTKLNSSKNDFRKVVSDISFSFSSYIDESLDDSTREIFRKKFVSDLKKLQISYSKIRKEDSKISNFLLR